MTALFGKRKKKNDIPEGKPSKVASSPAPKKEKESKPKKTSSTSAGRPAKKSASAYREDVSFALLSPRITEKAAIASDRNVYTFVVHERANKTQIKKAVYQAYNVTPIRVNIINTKRKAVRRRSGTGYKKGFKKAHVFLKKGDSIEII